MVAQVATGSTSGNAQILQGGVWSKPVAFTVNSLQLTNVSPTSGAPGVSITISGSGFGAAQGSGVVWLGSTAGQVVTWSDTQIVAAVDATALTGIARVQQNGTWSNAVGFTVPGGSNSVTLLPNLLNLVVGDTHTIQAVNSASQPVTGLTWTSSDPTVVSLSTDDPPVLTAVAAGHVTLTAGTASADVTVSAVALSLGTVLWSNPGNGSGVTKIVLAVPSPSGVADVFAFQNDGTVQAITSDGTTAWTAAVGCPGSASGLADFLGGLVALQYDCNNASVPTGIAKFDGLTGARSSTYMPGAPWVLNSGLIAVHPDGTIFTVEENSESSNNNPIPDRVVGIDPASGAEKFSVSLPQTPWPEGAGPLALAIAGDGYAYIPYSYRDFGPPDSGYEVVSLRMLRIDSTGNSTDFPVDQWTSRTTDLLPPLGGVNLITNADTGVVLTWGATGSEQDLTTGHPMMAITNGTSVSVMGAPDIGGGNVVAPVLQAQDGSFVGTATDNTTGTGYMVAFDASGNVRWTVAGYEPQIATDDGGVIATDVNTGSAVTFDQNGNATGRIGSLPTQSWTLNEYLVGSADQVVATFLNFGVSFAPFQRGSTSPGTPQNIPVDSKTNEGVKNLLTAATWRNFANSTCGSVFANPLGIPSMIPNYSLGGVQSKQQMTNFYDVGNPGIGNLTLRQVTGGQTPNNVTLTDYLTNGGAAAATANMGYDRQTAVILQANSLSQSRPEFTLVHELIFHAYAAQPDTAVFANAYFQQQGLWRSSGSNATVNISTWMGTDCTCTPGNPSAPACQPNTAKW